jgi:hypothetical protein
MECHIDGKENLPQCPLGKTTQLGCQPYISTVVKSLEYALSKLLVMLGGVREQREGRPNDFSSADIVFVADGHHSPTRDALGLHLETLPFEIDDAANCYCFGENDNFLERAVVEELGGDDLFCEDPQAVCTAQGLDYLCMKIPVQHVESVEEQSHGV